ncbi:hypothetical protein [Streptomyces sp. NPDC020965]|uniref:hypothetical protein n=1 Tax=Streptomyces sp. NPDC020965 TaxID=3365105 RepID=UPI00378C42C7
MSEPHRYPGRPIELPMQPEPLEPAPTRGCILCIVLDAWRTVCKNPDHPAYDPSRAIDCSIEIGNHPHTPPRMTLPTSSPDLTGPHHTPGAQGNSFRRTAPAGRLTP